MGAATPLIHLVEEEGFIKFIVAEFLKFFECSQMVRMFFGDGGNLIPEKPRILGMGLGIEP